jgi:hypothetical protein
MRSLKIGLGLLALTAFAGGVSLAQETPTRPPAAAAAGPQDGPHRFHPFADSHEARFDGPREGGRRDGGQRGGPGRMGGFRGDAGQHIEGRIAFLKAELKITDAQTRPWDQYATFMRDAAKTRADAQEARKAASPQDRPAPGEARQPRERKPLIERLGEQEKRLQTMLQLAQKRKAATESLFKVLNDEQKKLAEDLIRA